MVKGHKRVFEIWREGYLTDGEHSVAYKFGEIKAASFQEACEIMFAEDPYFNGKDLTYWGCQLYNNETEARVSFG